MAKVPQGKAWPDDAGCCTHAFPDACAFCDLLEARQRAAASLIQVKHFPSPLLACLACQLVLRGSRKDVNTVEDAPRSFYGFFTALTDPDLFFLLADKYDRGDGS